MTRPVEILPYDPQWAVAFSNLSTALSQKLGRLALRIEHIGSTSIPGLASKPIIDLDVVVETSHVNAAVQCLATIGYIHRGDLGIAGREAFSRESSAVPRVGDTRIWPEHHLYVCGEESPELARHIRFRDQLRANPVLMTEYAKLKYELASRFKNDRQGYTDGKANFVKKILTMP